MRSKILLWGHGVIRCKTPARARPEKISCSCPQKCRPFCGRSRFHMMFGLITRSYWVHFITPTSFLLSGAGQHQRHFHGQSILQTWCNGNVMMACPRMHMPRYGPQIEKSACDNMPFPVSNRMCGRAQATKPALKPQVSFAPVKKPRVGDFQHRFFGPSVKYAQWVRQVRRLQHFHRLSRAVAPPAGQLAEVWGSILRAKGFVPSFPIWWTYMWFSELLLLRTIAQFIRLTH